MIRRTKNGEYCIIVRIRVGGKIVTKRETIACTKETAKARFIDIKNELRTGSKSSSLTSSKRISTFAEVIDLYVTYLQAAGKLSKSHKLKIDRMRREIGTIGINDFGDRFEAWLKLESLVVRDRFDHIITGRTASPAKRNRIIEVARAAFNIAIDLKKLSVNPVDSRRFPKGKMIPRDEYLSPGEIEAILEVAKNERPHLFPILRYAFQVPCRKEELVRAKRADLDEINGVIRIRNGETKNDNGIFKPIPPDMVEYFRTLPRDTDYLFYRRGKDGVCRPLGNFRRAFYYCLEKAGVEKVTFHSSRHISATNMIDNGTPEQVVMSIAGWKTNMLRDYYHREPKQAMKLIKWGEKCEESVNRSGAVSV